MSRARPITLPDGSQLWFDMLKQGHRASNEHVELLAVLEQVELDDLLDTVLTQAEVLQRLRLSLGQGPIPTDVLVRREAWRKARQLQPGCRKCEKRGDSTKHHFVNKWILKELQDYHSQWADRSKNTINVCIDCHRCLHQRDDGAKSIVELLSTDEREFAARALTALADERPKLLILIARGGNDTYETRLVRDWIEGRFSDVSAPYARHLRAV